MALTLNELKKELDSALADKGRENSKLENTIKTRTIQLDDLDKQIEEKQSKLASLEKDFKEKNSVLLNRLESEKTEWDHRVKKYKAEEEKVSSERNGLNMDKQSYAQKVLALNDAGDSMKAREDKIKTLIEELGKIIK